MAKGFKHGAAGGTSLNFKVVGNPKPAAPKENTIWVNIDGKVEAWDFRTTAPENPTAGMVWLETGVTSPVEFSALKKQSLQLRPRTARQYSDGAWKTVEAEVFAAGEWKNLVDYNILYDHADNPLVTGGWEMYGATHLTTLTYTEDGHMILSCPNYNYRGYCRPVNKIDLTHKKTLKLVCSLGTSCYIGAFGALEPGNSNGSGRLNGPLKHGEYAIDVSAASGEKYLIASSCSNDVIIEKFWME